MKVRSIKKILNNTGYIVANHGSYLAVGSLLCHDLITLDVNTLKLRYALDRGGRDYLTKCGYEELLFIWDTLQSLIDSGQIHHLLTGRDTIENPLPLFRVNKGQLIESVTDAYGWPNTDDNGIQQYGNSHFPTAVEALRYGIKESKASIKYAKERRKELRSDLKKVNERINESVGHIATYFQQLVQIDPKRN